MGLKNIASKAKHSLTDKDFIKEKADLYVERYKKYCFSGTKGSDEKQYEAIITRYDHTIEKGLAYVNFRAGFGKKNLTGLLESMENYIKDGYSQDTSFYQTGLSTLYAYISKNKAYGYTDEALEKRVAALGIAKNADSGILEYEPLSREELSSADYETLILSRHSMRHFSSEPVDIGRVKRAVTLAQQTPSACNRQGWRTIIIDDKDIIKKVLENKNGNEGFGQEFDKLLLVVTDLRYFNKDRELFQPYIDGGMYAQSVLYALHFEHIAACPLSASLKREQEEHIRSILQLPEAEVPILLIGIGNYPEDKCQTARSERKEPDIQVI